MFSGVSKVSSESPWGCSLMKMRRVASFPEVERGHKGCPCLGEGSPVALIRLVFTCTCPNGGSADGMKS